MDDKGYVFEQTLEEDRRVVRIVTPLPKEAIEYMKKAGIKNEQLDGKNAQNKIVKYLFATTAGICKQVGVTEVHDALYHICAQLTGVSEGN